MKAKDLRLGDLYYQVREIKDDCEVFLKKSKISDIHYTEEGKICVQGEHNFDYAVFSPDEGHVVYQNGKEFFVNKKEAAQRMLERWQERINQKRFELTRAQEGYNNFIKDTFEHDDTN